MSARPMTPGDVMKQETEDLVSRLVSALTALAEKMGAERRLPAILTPQQFAREVSRSVSTVREMVRAGKVASVMVGGRLGIPSKEIDRLQNEARYGTDRDSPTVASMAHNRRASDASDEDTELVRAAIRADSRKRRR